jgi:glutamyl-tRNA reductase
MEFIIIGINHNTAGIEIREKVSFQKEEIHQALREIQKSGIITECVILSTCNRMEVYAVPIGSEEGRAFFQKFLNNFKHVSFFDQSEYTYFYSGQDAVRHLFRVVAGVNSQILGEPQILGQVKDAYFEAFESKMTGPTLNKLFHFAFHVGKRVRTETQLGSGAASVGSTAVQLMVEKFGDLKEKSALLIGTGETGTLIARHLHKNNIGKLFITNRTIEHATELSKELNAKVVPFVEFPRMLGKMDIILSATSSPEYIITKSLVETFLSKRGGKELHIIDVAVPRDVEREVRELSRVTVYDVDELSVRAEQYKRNRMAEIPEVEKIIEEEIVEVNTWAENLKITKVITRLQQQLEMVRKQVIEKNRKNFNQADWNQLDRLTTSLVNKILSTPLKQLKEYNRDPSIGYQKIETVSELFALQEVNDYSLH